MMIFDRREYTGPLWEQIDEAFQFVLRNIHIPNGQASCWLGLIKTNESFPGGRQSPETPIMSGCPRSCSSRRGQKP